MKLLHMLIKRIERNLMQNHNSAISLDMVLMIWVIGYGMLITIKSLEVEMLYSMRKVCIKIGCKRLRNPTLYLLKMLINIRVLIIIMFQHLHHKHLKLYHLEDLQGPENLLNDILQLFIMCFILMVVNLNVLMKLCRVVHRLSGSML